MSKHPLENKLNSTVRYLRSQDLLTPAHDLTIQLLKSLCAEWSEATSSTQRATLSKEIRQALAMLPSVEVQTSDAADDFLAGLSGD